METVDEFAERWVENYPRPAHSTNLHNAERVKAIADDFEGIRLDDVTKQAARHWAVEHRDRLPAVRAMFGDMVRDGILAANPFAGLGLPAPKGREEITVLTVNELDLLEHVARTEWPGWGERVFGPAIRLAAYTGLRPGELGALRWAHVEHDELHIKRAWSQREGREKLPKHDKLRTVELLPDARAALGQLEAGIPGDAPDLVVEALRGGRLTGRALSHAWVPVRDRFWKLLAAERLEEVDRDFGFYELRHFYGTQLATVWELSPYEIADQMGHSDGGILAAKRYIHPVSRDVRAKLRAKIAAA